MHIYVSLLSLTCVSGLFQTSCCLSKLCHGIQENDIQRNGVHAAAVDQLLPMLLLLRSHMPPQSQQIGWVLMLPLNLTKSCAPSSGQETENSHLLRAYVTATDMFSIHLLLILPALPATAAAQRWRIHRSLHGILPVRWAPLQLRHFRPINAV